MTTDTTARVSGTIKALEFEGSNGFWRADDGIGTFFEVTELYGAFHMCRIVHGHAKKMIPYDSYDAAKAAAQADYNARFLAAIQPDPEPMPQCCMCGKKGLITVEGDGGEECQLWDGRWTCSRACYDKACEVPATPSSAGMVSVEAAEQVLIAHLTHQHDLWCASKGRDPGEYVSRYSAAAAALRALAGES